MVEKSRWGEQADEFLGPALWFLNFNIFVNIFSLCVLLDPCFSMVESLFDGSPLLYLLDISFL